MFNLNKSKQNFVYDWSLRVDCQLPHGVDAKSSHQVPTTPWGGQIYFHL